MARSAPQSVTRQRQAAGPRRIKDLQPHEDSVFINHILSRLTPPTYGDPATPTSMLSQVILMDNSKSAQALAAVYFGKMCNHRRAYEKGSRLYVQALDQLRHSIIDPKSAASPETLASVLCLCIYENVALSEPMAWVRHYGGVSRLVELRGPNCQRTDREMDIFRVCRFMIVRVSSGLSSSYAYESRYSGMESSDDLASSPSQLGNRQGGGQETSDKMQLICFMISLPKFRGYTTNQTS